MKEKEKIMDVIEELERLVPEYSYSARSRIVNTDKEVRSILISELKEIKDDFFHLTQVSYELHKDELSDATEKVWDDVKILLDRVENSRVKQIKKSSAYFEEYKERIEHNLENIIRSDLEMIRIIKKLRKDVRELYKDVLSGKIRNFMRCLKDAKTQLDDFNILFDVRERSIVGA